MAIKNVNLLKETIRLTALTILEQGRTLFFLDLKSVAITLLFLVSLPDGYFYLGAAVISILILFLWSKKTGVAGVGSSYTLDSYFNNNVVNMHWDLIVHYDERVMNNDVLIKSKVIFFRILSGSIILMLLSILVIESA